MAVQLEDVRIAIDSILEFLNQHISVANSHASDFIIQNHWQLLPADLQDGLLQLSSDQLKNLPFTAHCSSGFDMLAGCSDTGCVSVTGRRVVQDSCVHECNGGNCKWEKCSDIEKSLQEEYKFQNRESVEAASHTYECFSNTFSGCLEEFCAAARKSTIEGHLLSMTRNNFLEHIQSLSEGNQSLEHIQCSEKVHQSGEHMNAKKCHEVEIMAEICNTMMKHQHCDMVVDFGSGKGYLGTQLVLYHGMPVLGIDARQTNTQSAMRRSKILDKQWEGLRRNADLSSQGITLTKKEKKKLKFQKLTEMEHHSSENVSAIPSIENKNNQYKHPENRHKPQAKYVSCTMFIDKNTNFTDLVKDHFPEIIGFEGPDIESDCMCFNRECEEMSSKVSNSQQENDKRIISQNEVAHCNTDSNCDRDKCSASRPSDSEVSGMVQDLKYLQVTQLADRSPKCPKLFLTGLHTCGSLANTSLEIFVNSAEIKGLCNVGCCYHLLEEKFERHSREADEGDLGEEKGVLSAVPGFPLSQFLTDKKLCLGKTARNLASQSVHRVGHLSELQGENFYPRALLEVLLREECDVDCLQKTKLRKLGQKSTSVQDYLIRACEKLGVSHQIPDSTLQSYLDKYEPFKHKLAAFFQLKTVLAPCIESLLILDRVCYLLEQETVSEVYLVKMFDPKTSPRCFGIVALK